MRARWIRMAIVPLVLIVAAGWWASPVLAEDNDKPAIEFKVGAGLLWGDTSDDASVPGEYFTFDDSPRLTFSLDTILTGHDWYAVTRVNWDHEDDNAFAVDFGWKDRLSMTLNHAEFRHRMVQDPMNTGIVVDFPELILAPVNPDVEPGINYSETNVAVRYKVTGVDNLTLHGSYRSQQRNGNLPMYGLNSHAAVWTAYGTATPIDQLTQDYAGGLTWKIGRVLLDNTYSYRRFDARDTAATLIPGLDQPFMETPDYKKWQNNLSARITLPHQTTVFASYVTYEVDNWYLKEQAGVDGMSYDSVQLRFHTILTNRVRLQGYYRTESTDNDVTKWYNPAVPSAMSRDVDTYGAVLTIKPYKGANLKLKYESRDIDRDAGAADATHVEKTSRDRYQVTFSSHLMDKARVRLEWKRDDVSNPFATLRYAAEAADYGEVYPELGAMATTSDRYRFQLDYNLTDRSTLALEYEYGDASYDTTTGVEQWNEDYTVVTLTLNFMPTDKLGLYLFASDMTGDATTWLAPDLADFEFVNNGVWTTGKVPYANDVTTFGFGFNYQASRDFHLDGTVSYVDMQAGADTSGLTAFGLDSWGAFSDHDSNYLDLTVNGEYRLDEGLGIRFRIGYGDYQDDSLYVRDLTGSGIYGVLGLTWRN